MPYALEVHVRAKRQRTVKEVLYVTFCDNKGSVMQIPVPKGRTFTGAFHEKYCFRKS